MKVCMECCELFDAPGLICWPCRDAWASHMIEWAEDRRRDEGGFWPSHVDVQLGEWGRTVL